LSVGRGHRDKKGRMRPMDVKKGDQIIFAEFAGSKLNYEGQELVIIRETDVMGVLD
jgi:chaperonin GroES